MARSTTRITVETDTFLLVRGAKAAVAWCPHCAAEVDVLTLAAAGHGPSAEPGRWMAAGRLHLWHTAQGATQICVDSLLHCFAYEEATWSQFLKLSAWR